MINYLSVDIDRAYIDLESFLDFQNIEETKRRAAKLSDLRGDETLRELAIIAASWMVKNGARGPVLHTPEAIDIALRLIDNPCEQDARRVMLSIARDIRNGC